MNTARSIKQNPPQDASHDAEITPEVLYVDDAILVVNKPAGLLAVPGRGPEKQDCLALRVAQHYPETRVVHRLDMATSGLMLFARSLVMQRTLSRLFETRQIEKQYMALVCGVLPESGEIALTIAPDWPNRPRQKIEPIYGKAALTRFRCLDAGHPVSRLLLEPITGRTHQLRVHLAAIGHPIVGDTLYEGTAAERLMLHATMLAFIHPERHERLLFESAAPF